MPAFRLKICRITIGLAACLAFNPLFAQSFHALDGSSLAGSLGAQHNPASIAGTPYPWDLTLFAFQVKGSSNFVSIRDYSLLSSPAQSKYYFKSGQGARYFDLNSNIHLLNFRLALGRKRSLAGGLNLKTYAQGSSSAYQFIDTLHSSADFLALNESNRPLQAGLTGSSWIEIFGTYAQILLDDAGRRLQAGISLKISRGLSAAFAQLDRGNFSRIPGTSPPGFQVLDASWRYGYSANFDHWYNNAGSRENLNNFLAYTSGGASIDLGAEYLIRSADPPVFGEPERYFDYEWKFGISLLDLGFNNFKYGRDSRQGAGFLPGVTDLTLDQKFGSGISSVKAFTDSLETIAARSDNLSGRKFRLLDPTRIILNADHHLEGSFFLNADLSLSLASVLAGHRLYVSDMNLLTITPRWETRRWGAYLPLQLNMHQQFWVGAAFKAGPLVLGFHNLGHLFSKKSFPNGGGYLALLIHPSGITRKKEPRIYDCPKPLFRR